MGPRSFERGNPMRSRKAGRKRRAELQWGRAHSSAEIIGVVSNEPIRRKASMGPRSFERGNGSFNHRIGHCIACFNGAALIRARKSHIIQSARSVPGVCFNGAALIRARKWAAKRVKVTLLAPLQWGRAHSSAEINRPQAGTD